MWAAFFGALIYVGALFILYRKLPAGVIRRKWKIMRVFENCKKAAISLIVIGGILFFHGMFFGTEQIEYGGDAYTGIQNAAADTANNIVKATGFAVMALGVVLQNYCEIQLFEYEDNKKRHEELVHLLGGNFSALNEEDCSKIDKSDTVFKQNNSLTELIIQNGVTKIGIMEFHDYKSLISVTIPCSVTSIGRGAFYNCNSLICINFEGTKEQWNAIEKAEYWNANTDDYIINCTDGTITE